MTPWTATPGDGEPIDAADMTPEQLRAFIAYALDQAGCSARVSRWWAHEIEATARIGHAEREWRADRARNIEINKEKR